MPTPSTYVPQGYYDGTTATPTIDASTLGAPQTPAAVPSAPIYTDPTPHVAGANATIAANTTSITPPADPNAGTADNIFTQMMKSLPTPPSASDQYATDYGNSGITQAQNDLNGSNKAYLDAKAGLDATTASLAGINAMGQARALQTESAGGLVSQLSGRQAEINRQTAIQALPLQAQALAQQAQVAAAQGKVQLSQSILQQAQQHLDTVYQIHQQDAQAQYKYKTDLIQSIYQYADKSEQRKLDALTHKEDQAFQVKLEGIRQANDIAKINLQKGLDTPAGDNPQLYAGLGSSTATAIRQRVTNFKSEPVVQNFSTIQEGRNFANALDTKTKNPADDQALIYSLAKALDPGSVVREGEYATAQKYAQSWIKAYGSGVSQAVNGTGFLSETARKNIKDTIESRYKAAKVGYDQVSSQYASGIDALSGRSDGTKFLTNYVTPSKTNSTIVTAPDGQQIEITD